MQLKIHLLYISSKIQELTKSNNPNTGPLEVRPQKKKSLHFLSHLEKPETVNYHLIIKMFSLL